MINKRGSVFFGVTIGIFIYIMGVLLLPFVMDDVTTFRDAMDCSGSDISGGTMLSCLISDAAIPYLIWFFVSLAFGFIIGGKT